LKFRGCSGKKDLGTYNLERIKTSMIHRGKELNLHVFST